MERQVSDYKCQTSVSDVMWCDWKSFSLYSYLKSQYQSKYLWRFDTIVITFNNPICLYHLMLAKIKLFD